MSVNSFCLVTVFTLTQKKKKKKKSYKAVCFTRCWLIASKHVETVDSAAVFVQASKDRAAGTETMCQTPALQRKDAESRGA